MADCQCYCVKPALGKGILSYSDFRYQTSFEFNPTSFCRIIPKRVMCVCVCVCVCVCDLHGSYQGWEHSSSKNRGLNSKHNHIQLQYLEKMLMSIDNNPNKISCNDSRLDSRHFA